jgi:signal transduction histidine kinase
MTKRLPSKIVRYAVGLAMTYAALSSGYILLSSTMAADASRSIEQLRRIETLKGIGFVAVTSLAAFFGAYLALRRTERYHEELRRRDHALVAAAGRALAGLIASSVAHDANNVLVVVMGEVDDLETSVPAGDERIQRLREAVRRLIHLNRRLMKASRETPEGDRREVDVAEIVRESAAALGAHAHLRQCRVRFQVEGDMRTKTMPLLIDQILNNLLLNAGEATSGKGEVEVRLTRSASEIVLEVHDNGPGVPRDRRADLFDALSTTKPDGNGLGLFSVKACAAALGGRVEVDDSPMGGATFRVHLPASGS